MLGSQANLGRDPVAAVERDPIADLAARSTGGDVALPAIPLPLDRDRSGILANIRCPIRVCDMVFSPSEDVA
jgi:hypothetical protein